MPQVSKNFVRSAQLGAAILMWKGLKSYLDRAALGKLKGGFAVVTGASSGIGYALAEELAQAGCDLLIVAENAEIKEAHRSLKEYGIRVEALQEDLSSFDGVEKLYSRIRDFGRPVDILVINAGVGYGGDFVRDEELRGVIKMIDLNVTSSVHLAKRVLEDMVKRNQGRVLFTSSIASYMAGSFEAVYSATKAFIESFAQGIRNELKNTNVTITTLQPGATEANFFRRAQMEETFIGSSKKDDPAIVARQGVIALARGQSYVVAGSTKNRILAGLGKFLPQTVTAQIHRGLSKPGTGDIAQSA
jgi:short-subunit dehydrogenase